MGYLPVEMLVAILFDLFNFLIGAAVNPATGGWGSGNKSDDEEVGEDDEDEDAENDEVG